MTGIRDLVDRVDALAAAAIILGVPARDIRFELDKASAAVGDYEAERASEEDAALALEAADISIHALIDAHTSKDQL